MSYDPPDPVRLDQIRGAAAAGHNPSPLNQHEEIALAQGRGDRSRQQLFDAHAEMIRNFPIGAQPGSGSSDSALGKLFSLLGVAFVIVIIWAGLTIGPPIRHFFDSHWTDPYNANLLGKDALKHRDYPEARYWFEIGATHGNAESEFYLGLMDEQGVAAPANKAEGLKWLKKSAVSNFAPAKQWLAKNGR